MRLNEAPGNDAINTHYKHKHRIKASIGMSHGVLIASFSFPSKWKKLGWLVLTVCLTRPGVTCEESLSEKLSRSGWPMGKSAGDFVDYQQRREDSPRTQVVPFHRLWPWTAQEWKKWAEHKESGSLSGWDSVGFPLGDVASCVGSCHDSPEVMDIIVIGIVEVYSFRRVHLRNCQSGGFVHTSRVTDTRNVLCCNISVTRRPDFSSSNRIFEVHHSVCHLSLS